MIVRLRETMRRAWIPERMIEQINECDSGCVVLVTDRDGYADVSVVDNFDSLMMQLAMEAKHET